MIWSIEPDAEGGWEAAPAYGYDDFGYEESVGWYNRDDDDPATPTEEVLLNEIKALRADRRILRGALEDLIHGAEEALKP